MMDEKNLDLGPPSLRDLHKVGKITKENVTSSQKTNCKLLFNNLKNIKKGSYLPSDEEHYKIFSGYVEVSRKWVSVMDAKAGFIAALNIGILAFLWSGAKFAETAGAIRYLAFIASFLCLASILCALFVAMPRESLRAIFNKKINWSRGYKPISFYGYVALAYRSGDFSSFKKHVIRMSFAELATEALEQHFVISHSIVKKSKFVRLAAVCLISSLIATGLILIIRTGI